jgi:glycine reductase complex component B subunit alpha and beta
LSSTLADLRIATFAIDEVVEGTKTGRDGATLVVDVPQLAVGAASDALAEVTVEVVRPGDRVRIANVLDVVLPDVRVDDPHGTFPGVLDPRRAAWFPVGAIHRLEGVVVVSVCDWRAARYPEATELPDAFVDLAGPGADRNPWAGGTTVVVRCVPAAGASVQHADAAVRRAALRVARELASTTIGAIADRVDRWSHPGAMPADPAFPAVGVVLQIASEGPLLDTFRVGRPMGAFVPTIADLREPLAGAILNGAYDWAAVRNVSAVYQGSALIRELLAGHGERFRAAGLVLAPGYLDGADAKQRAASETATLLAELGADAAVCTTFSSGNSHTDTMLTIRACEQRGIATVGLLAETNGGLTDHVPEADCLVTTGNEDELVDAWVPDRVIGDDGEARSGAPVPTWAYVGACAETGDARLMAEPA